MTASWIAIESATEGSYTTTRLLLLHQHKHRRLSSLPHTDTLIATATANGTVTATVNANVTRPETTLTARALPEIAIAVEVPRLLPTRTSPLPLSARDRAHARLREETPFEDARGAHCRGRTGLGMGIGRGAAKGRGHRREGATRPGARMIGSGQGVPRL